MSDAPAPERRKIGSRACDACRVRKVRCAQVQPCERCASHGIACTFNKVPGTRGPRSLRSKTLQQIRFAQVETAKRLPTTSDNSASNSGREAAPDGSPSTTTDSPDAAASGIPAAEAIPVAALVLRLCIYRVRLFPVWPIVAIEDVIAAVQRDRDDLETCALANAIGAATMAQLRLDRARNADINDAVTAHMLEAECRRARTLLETTSEGDDSPEPNLNTLRTSFFLHIYHENQRPGGSKSLLFLREAISLLQILDIPKFAPDLPLPVAEQMMRRRIFALLFVTERGVAMLHGLPVVLVSGAKLPPLDGADKGDETHVLPAFRKLVKLFWMFDQSGAFDMITKRGSDELGGPSQSGEVVSTVVVNINTLERLQRRLQDIPLDGDTSNNDIQKADICVTRHWMQILLWRAHLGQKRRGHLFQNSEADHVASRPIQIANDFLDSIERLPNTAIEAHGPTIEHKIYEIASAVTDAIADQLMRSRSVQSDMELRPNHILVRLQKMLGMCRGGNKSLLASLCARITRIEDRSSTEVGPLEVRQESGHDDIAVRGRSLDRWFPTRTAISNGNEATDYQAWNIAGPASPSSWFSLLAAAGLDQRSFQNQAQREETGGKQGHLGQQHDYSVCELSDDISFPADISWQPFALLGQIEGRYDQHGYLIGSVGDIEQSSGFHGQEAI